MFVVTSTTKFVNMHVSFHANSECFPKDIIQYAKTRPLQATDVIVSELHKKNRLHRYQNKIENLEVNTVQITTHGLKSLVVILVKSMKN